MLWCSLVSTKIREDPARLTIWGGFATVGEEVDMAQPAAYVTSD
jgi:hypothetical protein